MMTDWEKAAEQALTIAAAINKALPVCNICKCNWPKKYIDTNGLCPNCRTGRKRKP